MTYALCGLFVVLTVVVAVGIRTDVRKAIQRRKARARRRRQIDRLTVAFTGVTASLSELGRAAGRMEENVRQFGETLRERMGRI